MKFRLLLFVFSLLFRVTLIAQSEVIKLSDIDKSQHLAPQSWILEDSEHKLSFRDLIEKDSLNDHFFQPVSKNPYMDFTTSAYWMKIQIKNDSSRDVTKYIELARPLTNVVNLFVFDQEESLVEVYLAGDEMEFKARPYQHRKFIFPVDFPANSTLTFVVQTDSDGEIVKLPLKLWDVEEFTQFSSTENFFLGLYYGLFILVIVLFTFFGIALRQNLYVYFVIYVFVLGLFQLSLDGLAYQYLWPCYPWIGNHAILVMAAISMIFMLLYVRRFLEFGEGYRRYMIGYNTFLALNIIGLFLSLTDGYIYQFMFPALNGLSFITILYIIYGLTLKFKSDDKPELPILMAFLGLVAGSVIFIMSNTNVIDNDFLAANALKLGSATEVLFLSLAMAGRYRKTQIEKIEAQKVAFKRLEEVNTLKEEQNIKLEQQVKERTEKISRQNDQLSAQNREIINSINYAKRLQDALLPSDQALNEELKNPSVLYLPKDIVSGDFYWMETTKNHVFIAVADCTGHGVPGSLVSVVGHNSLNRCVKELKLSDPAQILDQLTLMVEEAFTKEKTKVSDGMDIALCVWDRKDTLRFAGAFNPLYHIRNKELTEIKGDKQPIGKFIKRDPFTSHEIKLEKGDSIVMFSDGFADQFGGPRGKKLKYSRFKEYLVELNHLRGSEFSEAMANKLKQWKGEEEQIDDVCILQINF